MTDDNDFWYIVALEGVAKGYNATEHSATGYEPKVVKGEHAAGMLQTGQHDDVEKPPKFKLDDKVRVAKLKLPLE